MTQLNWTVKTGMCKLEAVSSSYHSYVIQTTIRLSINNVASMHLKKTIIPPTKNFRNEIVHRITDEFFSGQ